ncbi:NIF-domain-containing protein [Dendrothele bispora CBS 962.96]|uniref:NIF-domain-containing protein n=1 Tax=Dendrothele bispora (strain CBS 962.96) TaxID=1314807 RepID=A0A4S8MYS7_DENBC|nr:NIF-domain-containing protein [Dendrothele bispora CBS 962.96]
MNSLTYLSRAYDNYVTPKTPPSTPTVECPPNRHVTPSSDHSMKRAGLWSTRPFFRTSSGSSTVTKHRSSSAVASHKSPSGSIETLPSSKSHPSSLLSRIFLLRVLVLAWDAFRAAWYSLLEKLRLGGNRQAIDSLMKEKQPMPEDSSDEESLVSPLISLSRSTSDSLTRIDAQSISLQYLQPPASPVPQSPTDSSASTPRSATPLAARKPPFHAPKTLVLDLDETLIHSTSRPISSAGSSGFFGLSPFGSRKANAGHVVEVVLGGKSTLYHVYKRPFVDFFLRTVSGWYTLVIFTASMQEYADPVIDWLDAGRGILVHRLFRDLPNGSYTKDLTIIEPDLARVCLIDNSPVSYRVNEANGIPIEGWTHDPSDEALLDLLPVLDSLRFTSDVRRVLGLRTAGMVS